jgi:hypothetical protein
LFGRKGSEKEVYKPPAIPSAPQQTTPGGAGGISGVRSPEEELWFSETGGPTQAPSHHQDGKATTSAPAANMGSANLFASMDVVVAGAASQNAAPHHHQEHHQEAVNIYGQSMPESSASVSAFSFIASNPADSNNQHQASDNDEASQSGATSSFSFITSSSGPAAADSANHHAAAPPAAATSSAFSFVAASSMPSHVSTSQSPAPLPPRYTPDSSEASTPVSSTNPSSILSDSKQTIVHKPPGAGPVALPGMCLPCELGVRI